MLFGSILNLITILIGGTLGTFIGKGIPERISKAIINGIGLCVILIGIEGALKVTNMLLVIASMVIGGITGEMIDIDKQLERLANTVEKKFSKNGSRVSIAEGFVSASLIFSVGAMAIMGALESGLSENHQTLCSKAMLDGITALSLSSTLGIGVALSGFLVCIYQGSITLLSSVIQPFLTEAVIANMTSAGSLLIIGIGTNMLGITKLKIANYLPAIFVPVLYSLIINIFI